MPDNDRAPAMNQVEILRADSALRPRKAIRQGMENK